MTSEYDGVSPRVNMGEQSPYKTHQYKFGSNPGVPGHGDSGVKCMYRYCEKCNAPPEIECPDCEGKGFFSGSEHDPACPGDERFCQSHCPVEVQAQCETCQGSGRLSAASSLESTNS